LSTIKLPDIFEVIYEADCGEQYTMVSCLIPTISLPCDACGFKHLFKAKFLVETKITDLDSDASDF
jgi:DNA-directed RNA polymerase subunit RPC12/RpoP